MAPQWGRLAKEYLQLVVLGANPQGHGKARVHRVQPAQFHFLRLGLDMSGWQTTEPPEDWHSLTNTSTKGLRNRFTLKHGTHRCFASGAKVALTHWCCRVGLKHSSISISQWSDLNPGYDSTMRLKARYVCAVVPCVG